MPIGQFVIVEVNNGGVGVRHFVSDTPITLERLITYFETKGLDWRKDSITLIDPPELVALG